MADPSIIPSFHVHLHGPEGGPIPNAFERAGEALTRDCGALFEPDGSFGWASPGGEQKVAGMMYDARGQLQYVEMRGQCQRNSWRRLITAIVGFDPDGSAGTTDGAPQKSDQASASPVQTTLTIQSLSGQTDGIGKLQDLHLFEDAFFPPE